MLKSIFLFSFFLLAATFWGCKENTTESPSEKTNKLIPLTVGNTWNYKLYNSSSDSVGELIWKISRKILVDDKEYFLIEGAGFFGGDFVALEQNDGYLLSTYDSINGLTSPFFYKYPADNNETYQYELPDNHYQYPGKDSVINITVRKQVITIQNQNYNCYAYINENLTPNSPFAYFAENVGLVRHKLIYVTQNEIDTTNYYIYDLQNKSLNN